MTDATQGFDPVKAQTEEWVHVLRMQEETREFVQEQHKLIAEASKRSAEAAKLSRDRDIAPWQLVIGGVGAGAALVGATAALTAAAIGFFWMMAGGARRRGHQIWRIMIPSA